MKLYFMKSFNVVSVHLKIDGEFQNLDFLEGIIINNELGDDAWLIEISLQETRKKRLENFLNNDVDILVKITRPSNTPAHFEGKLVDITDLEGLISVIFKGDVLSSNPNYPVELLEELVTKGLSGEDLIEKFKQNMGNKKES